MGQPQPGTFLPHMDDKAVTTRAEDRTGWRRRLQDGVYPKLAASHLKVIKQAAQEMDDPDIIDMLRNVTSGNACAHLSGYPSPPISIRCKTKTQGSPAVIEQASINVWTARVASHPPLACSMQP